MPEHLERCYSKAIGAARTPSGADGPLPTDVLVTIRSRCRPVQLPVPSEEQVRYLLSRGVADPLARRAAGQGDAEEGTAWPPMSRPWPRQEVTTSLILNVRSISSAFSAAEKLTDLAEQDAQAVSARKG